MIVDVLDPAALNRALGTAKPDAVIHQLTDLPANAEPARAGDYAARNARLRRLGTAHLVSAVLQTGMRRLIAQSIAWTYSAADAPRTEADALDLAAGGTRAVSIGGVVALETAVLGNAAFTGIVLRYGALYGPGAGAEQPRRRTFTGAMIRRRSCHRTWSTEPWRPSDPLH